MAGSLRNELKRKYEEVSKELAKTKKELDEKVAALRVTDRVLDKNVLALPNKRVPGITPPLTKKSNNKEGKNFPCVVLPYF